MPGRARLAGIVGAGVVDSLGLSVAWTVLLLHVTRVHGLAAAGACSAALLVGVALSAPVAGWASRRLDGRTLLRTATALEVLARVGTFVALVTGAPLWVVASCVVGLSVTGWTGYAGMRAEVAAATTTLPAALTWYGTLVAAVEAVGVALASLLPPTGGTNGDDAVLLVVMGLSAAALLPTLGVARTSRVGRGAPAGHGRDLRPERRRRVAVPRASRSVVAGVALMAVASAPTLLAVALAAELHGRAAVGPAAVAFTAGSLLAPAVASRVQLSDANRLPTWALCGVAMVCGWVLAPLHLVWLCVAQLASGLGMTTLEGLLDTVAAQRQPHDVTGALARATAGRALGSAAGTAVLPLAIAWQGLPLTAGAVGVALAVLAVASVTSRAARRPPRPDPAPAVNDMRAATAARLAAAG